MRDRLSETAGLAESGRSRSQHSTVPGLVDDSANRNPSAVGKPLRLCLARNLDLFVPIVGRRYSSTEWEMRKCENAKMRKTKFEIQKQRFEKRKLRNRKFESPLRFAFRILFSAFRISSDFVIMRRVTSSPGSGNLQADESAPKQLVGNSNSGPPG